MDVRRWPVRLMLTILLLLPLLVAPVAVRAAGPGDVVIATPYPWVVAERGRLLTFDLEVTNRTQDYQKFDLRVVDGPEDWQPLFKDGGYTVRKVMLGPGGSRTLDFQVEPPLEAAVGDYTFAIKAVNASGTTLSSLNLQVTLSEKTGTGLEISAQYPSLRGRAGSTFSFKLDVKNNATEDRSVNLAADVPEGWEAVFKPAYESKQVSTIRMAAGGSQGIDVELTPPSRVEAGEYAVKVRATAGSDRDEVELSAVVLGDYKLSLNTPTGQLNTRAKLDGETKVALVVKNTGASTLENISFSAAKPEGWEVTFAPERIGALAPEQTQEVTATLKPGPRALAGDYMLDITASAGQASDSKGLRVTVETPTTWGLAGVGTIVFVLGGLGLLFARLSRR